MNERTEATQRRRRQALELRLAGATYDQIAQQVGYKSASGAHAAVQAELKLRQAKPDDAVVDTELARLDAMLTGVWAKARRGDVHAIDRVLRISERRLQLVALTYSDKPATTVEASPVDDLRKRRDARRAASSGS